MMASDFSSIATTSFVQVAERIDPPQLGYSEDTWNWAT